MKRMLLFLACTLLLVSLLGGCATSGPAQSADPLMESTAQRDGGGNAITDSPTGEGLDFELWSGLWQQLPHHDEGDNLAAILHYGAQMEWAALDRAGGWDYYNNSSEGPYYVIIPKYKRSTVIVETIQNHNGDYIPTGEVFRKDNAPENYMLAISNPYSEGADSLRITVKYENRIASFDYFYAAAIDSFPYMDNGILHIQPTGNTFGGGTSRRAYEFDTDLFGQTNELHTAESQQSGNAASSKTLYTRYATEGDLPAATREEQRLIDTYLAPYSASGLYRTNFTPNYMNEISAFTLSVMFDSLCHQFGGYPSETDILPGSRVAGDVFEGKLMKHLPLTPQMIRKICTSYNPADGTYELNPGIGSAPVYYVITEYVELDTALRISYAYYGLASNETYTEDYIKLYGTGTTVINRTEEAYTILGNVYQEV